MLTTKRYHELRTGYAPFLRAVSDFKELLEEYNLPLSIDATALKFNVKLALFEGMMKVDKGLKYRYDLLKSEDARRVLIEATIDLTGYAIADVETFIAAMETTLTRGNQRMHNDGLFPPTLSVLVAKYELNIDAWLQQFVIVWKGADAATLAVVQRLHDTMNEVQTLLGLGRRGVTELLRFDELNELEVYSAVQCKKKLEKDMLAARKG